MREDASGCKAIIDSGVDENHTEKVFSFAKDMLRIASRLTMPNGAPLQIRVGEGLAGRACVYCMHVPHVCLGLPNTFWASPGASSEELHPQGPQGPQGCPGRYVSVRAWQEEHACTSCVAPAHHFAFAGHAVIACVHYTPSKQVWKILARKLITSLIPPTHTSTYISTHPLTQPTRTPLEPTPSIHSRPPMVGRQMPRPKYPPNRHKPPCSHPLPPTHPPIH